MFETVQQELESICNDVVQWQVGTWIGCHDDDCCHGEQCDDGTCIADGHHPCPGLDAVVDRCQDIRYVIDKGGNILGAHVLLASGHPTIWADTHAMKITGTWAFNNVVVDMNREVATDVNDYLSTCFTWSREY